MTLLTTELVAIRSYFYMIPGRPRIMRCPGCIELLLFPTLVSSNTAGVRSWSDGKTFAPSKPTFPEFLTSPNEGGVFWADECEELSPDSFVGAGIDLGALAYPREPSIDQYHTVLSEVSSLPPEREYYLRQRLGWLYNDTRRDKDPINSFRLSDLEVSNVNALIDLLEDALDPGSTLIRADLLRSLSKFDECEELLQDRPWLDHPSYLADLIFSKSSEQNSTVFEIPEFSNEGVALARSAAASRRITQNFNRESPETPRPAEARKAFYNNSDIFASDTYLAKQIGLGKMDTSYLKGSLKLEGRILDAGCGFGRVAVGLWVLGARNVEACDFSPAQVESARDYIEQNEAKIRVFEADFLKLPVDDGYYDAIVCLGGTFDDLYSYEEVQAALNEFARVVKTGGTLIYSLRRSMRSGRGRRKALPTMLYSSRKWSGGGINYDFIYGSIPKDELEAFGERTYFSTERLDGRLRAQFEAMVKRRGDRLPEVS